jgi:urocanate hydratase
MAENFNEMLGPDGEVRAPYVILKDWLDTQSPG